MYYSIGIHVQPTIIKLRVPIPWVTFKERRIPLVKLLKLKFSYMQKAHIRPFISFKFMLEAAVMWTAFYRSSAHSG